MYSQDHRPTRAWGASPLAGGRSLEIALLLAANGGLLAITLMLSRMAQSQGLSPVAYGFWMSLGGALLLALLAGRQLHSLRSRRVTVYSAIAGLISLAVPQLLIFIAVGRIGAGLASIVYALPVLVTFTMARALGLEARSPLRMAGTIVGALGAALLLWPGSGGLPLSALPWMALALAAPVFLASGNIYRSVAWPEGVPPKVLAAGMLIAATVFFALAAVPFGSDLRAWRFDGVSMILPLQAVIAALQFLAYFALQRVAPPVIFSLLGHVALMFGLLLGMVFLGESYGARVFGAVFLMGVGLVLVMNAHAGKSGRRPKTPVPQPCAQ